MKRHFPKVPAVAEVQWEDSWVSHNWRDRTERANTKDRSALVRSVGFVIRNDKECIRLTQGLDDNDNTECQLTIPKFAVRSVKILRRSEERKR
jgi:hypothetical protein